MTHSTQAEGGTMKRMPKKGWARLAERMATGSLSYWMFNSSAGIWEARPDDVQWPGQPQTVAVTLNGQNYRSFVGLDVAQKWARRAG